MDKGSGVFCLDLYAIDAVPCSISAQSCWQNWKRTTQGRCTLAFTFLDYPTVLLHAAQEAADSISSSLKFGGGKRCVIDSDAGELVFLARRVRTAAVAACQHVRSQRMRAACVHGHIMCIKRLKRMAYYKCMDLHVAC